MFFLPLGIEGLVLRRMPWISITLAALMVLSFLATWVIPANPFGEHSARMEALADYWQTHPNAAIPEALATQWTAAQRQRAEAVHTQSLTDDGPAANEVQSRLTELETAANEPLADPPLVRLALHKGHGPVQLGLITSLFLHLGWMHIIFNLLFFYMTGPLLEDAWGKPVFAGFYLVGGIVAGLTEWALSRHELGIVVGASGAIAACMGAFAVRYASAQVRIGYIVFTFKLSRGTFLLPAWAAGGAWMLSELYSAVTGDSPGVAVAAHIGGFVFGVLMAIAFKQVAFGADEEVHFASETSVAERPVIPDGARPVVHQGVRRAITLPPDSAAAMPALAEPVAALKRTAEVPIREVTVGGAGDEGLIIFDLQKQRSKLPWAEIEAIGAALAPTDGPIKQYVPLTDLVLKNGQGILRIRATGLGLSLMFPGMPAKQAYAAWLKRVADWSGATFLGNSRAVQEGRYPRFESAEEVTAALHSAAR